MAEIAHWYHVWSDGVWKTPVEEHLSALARIGYDGPFHVGVVGGKRQRAEAIRYLTDRRPPKSVVEKATGFEQVTLQAVRKHAQQHPDGVTLYAHTKGAGRPDRLQDAWRRSMTCALLSALDVHVQTLGMIYDLVGCHWLEPGRYTPAPGQPKVQVDRAMMAGNFWLARNDYLNKLPQVPTETRHDAETWLGLGGRKPRVLDLNPGWPGTVSWFTRIGWPR